MSDKSTNNTEKDAKNIPYEVTPVGSLGLLALGAVGLKAWRQKREEFKALQEKNKEQNKEDKKENNG